MFSKKKRKSEIDKNNQISMNEQTNIVEVKIKSKKQKKREKKVIASQKIKDNNFENGKKTENEYRPSMVNNLNQNNVELTIINSNGT